jgi:pectinesterase
MADTNIYLVPTTNIIQWGRRVYYFNCHRVGGNDFGWYADNLPAGLQGKDVTVDWLFKKKWKPEGEK